MLFSVNYYSKSYIPSYSYIPVLTHCIPINCGIAVLSVALFASFIAILILVVFSVFVVLYSSCFHIGSDWL